MEDKFDDIDKKISEIETQVKEKKNELSTINNKTPMHTNLPQHDTDVMALIKEQEKELMSTKEVQELGKRWGEERIKSDLAAEASRIKTKNIETAEREFENETRELRLKHLKAELDKQHKYNMETLDQDAKHSQMLDRRKKLVEKFGYLYDNNEENMVTAYDSKGEPYKVPKDFSYSVGVNKMRQFGRNISKLDKPILQTLKWVLILGGGIAVIFILKHFGII